MVVLGSAERRQRVRPHLTEDDIIPAVHWPLERNMLPVNREARALSRRMLSIRSDGRYGTPDILRIGAILADMGEA